MVKVIPKTGQIYFIANPHGCITYEKWYLEEIWHLSKVASILDFRYLFLQNLENGHKEFKPRPMYLSSSGTSNYITICI